MSALRCTVCGRYTVEVFEEDPDSSLSDVFGHLFSRHGVTFAEATPDMIAEVQS